MARSRKFRFVHVDVFARRQLEGNQLAVFTDSGGMSDALMQSIAREMRLSETTFVERRKAGIESVQGVKTRIFTPQEELPFAGHPTLGTAWVLREAKRRVVLDLKVGKVPVEFRRRDGAQFGEMTQPAPRWGAIHKPTLVADALGINEFDLDSTAGIQTVSTGNPFAIVPFRSLDKLMKLTPDLAKMEKYLRGTDAKFFYMICRETKDPQAVIHARMIFYGGDDPATGSAAGPAAAWMLRRGWLKPNELKWVEQGIEVDRPSQIFIRVGGSREKPGPVRVGGYCFGVMEGELALHVQ